MILLTGGSGRLGRELIKLMPSIYAPTSNILDITKQIPVMDVDVVIHSAAYTNMLKAEEERKACFDVNVLGTFNLVNAYKNTPFVYISSEYAHKPVNFYSITKSLAEQIVMTHPNYLIIRTLFKERPWKGEFAFKDKFTQGDYLDVIAPLVVKEITEWDFESKLVYVGTGRKTYYELALQSRLDVKPNSIKDVSIKIPYDYT